VAGMSVVSSPQVSSRLLAFQMQGFGRSIP
jgi:hypothetical protein